MSPQTNTKRQGMSSLFAFDLEPSQQGLRLLRLKWFYFYIKKILVEFFIFLFFSLFIKNIEREK